MELGTNSVFYGAPQKVLKNTSFTPARGVGSYLPTITSGYTTYPFISIFPNPSPNLLFFLASPCLPAATCNAALPPPAPPGGHLQRRATAARTPCGSASPGRPLQRCIAMAQGQPAGLRHAAPTPCSRQCVPPPAIYGRRREPRLERERQHHPKGKFPVGFALTQFWSNTVGEGEVGEEERGDGRRIGGGAVGGAEEVWPAKEED